MLFREIIIKQDRSLSFMDTYNKQELILEQLFEIVEIHYSKQNRLFIQDVTKTGHGGDVEEKNFLLYSSIKRDSLHIEETTLNYLWKLIPKDYGYKVERYTDYYCERGICRDPHEMYIENKFITPNPKYYQLEYLDYEWDLFYPNTYERLIWEPNPLLELER